MADRTDWEAATCVQRHLAVAADAELRRRHPEQRFTPLATAFNHDYDTDDYGPVYARWDARSQAIITRADYPAA